MEYPWFKNQCEMDWVMSLESGAGSAFRLKAQDPGLRTPNELLHAVILRVRHIEIPLRIEGQTPRIIELSRLRSRSADDFDKPAVRVENLNPAVAEFANEHQSLRIHANVVRIAELARPAARSAKFADELSLG